MNVINQIPVIEWALWPQGDIRDPLGVWTARGAVIGDASGGVTGGVITVPAAKRRAYIYTCYAATVAKTVGSAKTATELKVRLLTNFPDASPDQVGLQGFATLLTRTLSVETNTTDPSGGPFEPLITSPDRYVLLFDPSAVSPLDDMDIVSMERNANEDGIQLNFEAWGYYWDRSVLNAPGGLRHPGSN